MQCNKKMTNYEMERKETVTKIFRNDKGINYPQCFKLLTYLYSSINHSSRRCLSLIRHEGRGRWERTASFHGGLMCCCFQHLTRKWKWRWENDPWCMLCGVLAGFGTYIIATRVGLVQQRFFLTWNGFRCHAKLSRGNLIPVNRECQPTWDWTNI